MEALSDDEFDHVRDFDMTDPESDIDSDQDDHDTPSTTPPRTQTPRPSASKPIVCPYKDCPKTFNRNSHLEEHLRSHTGDRPFKCPHAFCPQTYLRETHLKHHLKSAHSTVRDHACTWEGCDKAFATGTRLRRHLKAHEDKEQYRCRGYDGCNATFRKHETLRKHILIEHEDTKPFPCDYVHPESGALCTKAFDTADRLKNHKRAMHDNSKYSCTICANNHGTADTLMTTEDQPSPFSFATFPELQSHITQAHPLKCPYCTATSVSNKEYKRHLELDHGIIDDAKQNAKKFPCTYPDCDHVSTKQGNLNVHVKTVHEKKKEFICGVTNIPVPLELQGRPQIELLGCSKSFTSKASLIEHVRTAHFLLPSKRAQREEAKKRKRVAEDSLSYSAPKRRMPRKDKGTKKVSTLDTLVGTNEVALSTSFPIIKSYSEKSPASHSFDEIMDDDADETDDLNQLSGSMTIFGQHLYHNGQAHHLVSEDDNADLVTVDEGQYIPCQNGQPMAFQDAHIQPFFDFEHEQELIRSHLDPVLLQA